MINKETILGIDAQCVPDLIRDLRRPNCQNTYNNEGSVELKKITEKNKLSDVAAQQCQKPHCIHIPLHLQQWALWLQNRSDIHSREKRTTHIIYRRRSIYKIQQERIRPQRSIHSNLSSKHQTRQRPYIHIRKNIQRPRHEHWDRKNHS